MEGKGTKHWKGFVRHCIFHFHRDKISWSSKKQSLIALSTTETKYITATHVTTHWQNHLTTCLSLSSLLWQSSLQRTTPSFTLKPNILIFSTTTFMKLSKTTKSKLSTFHQMTILLTSLQSPFHEPNLNHSVAHWEFKATRLERVCRDCYKPVKFPFLVS